MTLQDTLFSILLQLLVNTSAGALLLALFFRCSKQPSPRRGLILCWTTLMVSICCAVILHVFRILPHEISAASGILVADGLSNAIAVVWVAGIAVLSVRFLVARHRLKTILSRSTKPVYLRTVGGLRDGSRIIPIRISADIFVPAVFGIRRPVILIPKNLRLEQDQWDSVLQHEAAHILRRDPFWNLVLNLVEIGAFFSPGVWWISRNVRELRECAADDWVIRRTRAAVPLVEALVRMAELRPLYSALPFASGNGQLFRRTQRLLALEQRQHAFRLPVLLLVTAVCLQIVIPSIQFVPDSTGEVRIRTITRTTTVVTVR